MSQTFTTEHRVQFRDTDAAGIMHFSAFFTYMEEAEHELLRNLGLSVLMDEAERVSWPRVAADCQFQRPLLFEDLFQVHVHVARLGEKSVTYAFRFTHAGEQVAVGTMTSVCCLVDQRPLHSIPIPARIVDKLKPMLAT